MNLKITLTDDRGQYSTIDDPGPTTTTWDANMDDCSVHAWFKVFESVLGSVGHTERSIMTGACQLAFNDCRSLETMKTIAKEYDLTNWDD
jgi:hypothetical protein